MVASKPSGDLVVVEPAPPDELSEQADFFASYSQIVPDRVSDLLLVLNQQRQITYANRAAREFLEDGQPSDILGHLLGGVLHCVHAEEGNGCGTTEACQLCGANKTIRRSLAGVEVLQECRISRRDGEALDLLVWGSPMWFQEKVYVLLTIRDISHEKRRRALERIFFHDVLNTATGIVGYTALLEEATSLGDEEIVKDLLVQLANRLVEEIKSQRILLDAENDDLVITPGTVYSLSFLSNVVAAYQTPNAAQERKIAIDPGSCEVVLTTDLSLLWRVLSNMIKNAVEATSTDQMVTVGCTMSADTVEFTVHNPTYMPREAQLQVFQRSFSTKGNGRGLGTYSMRMLSERYLQGEVSFTSTKGEGTTFTARYPLKLEI